MSVASKCKLLFNTVKYLKLAQLQYQILNRLKPKELFTKYMKTGVVYKEYSLWLDGLDDDKRFVERFKPDSLLDNELTLLNETRFFDSWSFQNVSHLWIFNAHYMEYLVALKAKWRNTGEKKYKEKLNEILSNWYTKGAKESDSNQAYTISLRIVNMLLIADCVKEKNILYDYIYAQYRFLINHQEKHLLGNHYLENLKAIVIASLVFDEDDIYRLYIVKFLKELREQTTHDGLHYELSLMYHKIVFEDVIRVAVILRQAGKPEYKAIKAYINIMGSALFSLEFGINRTPLFNDAGDNVSKPTDALLGIAKNRFCLEPERKNSISGYYKLFDGLITAIIDCGSLAPSYMPGHGHCDCLSFEVYYEGKPMFVNSGTFQYQGEYRNYFRSTAAHNTVVINDHEQSEYWGEHRVARRINNIRCTANEGEVTGSCKNFLGEKHIRQFSLRNGILEVVDQTTGNANSYLHFAPGVVYKDGLICCDNIIARIIPINSAIDVIDTYYSSEFGKIERNKCIVFSWNSDNEKHGYRIEFIKGENKND